MKKTKNQDFSRKRFDTRGFKIARRVVIVLAVLFVFYELFLGTLIAYFYRDFGYKDGRITSYQTQSYIRYDGGKEAAEFFPRYEELSDWESVKFYYKDNSIHNNIFYGKMPDYFTLSIRYSPEIYADKVAEAIDSVDVMDQWERNYTTCIRRFYIIREEKDRVWLIITAPDKNSIRYVLVNDFEHTKADLSSLDIAMSRNYIPWE